MLFPISPNVIYETDDYLCIEEECCIKVIEEGNVKKKTGLSA